MYTAAFEGFVDKTRCTIAGTGVGGGVGTGVGVGVGVGVGGVGVGLPLIGGCGGGSVDVAFGGRVKMYAAIAPPATTITPAATNGAIDRRGCCGGASSTGIWRLPVHLVRLRVAWAWPWAWTTFDC